MTFLGYGLDPWGLGAYGSVTPAGPLSFLSAVAISTNEVQVTLTRPPLAESPTAPGDALNPATWTVQRLDIGAFHFPLSVRPVENHVFIVTVFQPFGPSYVQHRISSTTLVDDVGDLVSAPTSADFAGILGKEVKDAPARASLRSNAVRDVANPPTPGIQETGIGGTLVINSSGDYDLESGVALLRKLILRRLTTQPGGFFHLPDYGVRFAVKEAMPPSALIQLKAEIQNQVLREPEVEEANATLILGTQNDIAIKLRVKLRPTGDQFDLALQATPEGVLL